MAWRWMLGCREAVESVVGYVRAALMVPETSISGITAHGGRAGDVAPDVVKADTSRPIPGGLKGHPDKGGRFYLANCATCHGARRSPTWPNSCSSVSSVVGRMPERCDETGRVASRSGGGGHLRWPGVATAGWRRGAPERARYLQFPLLLLPRLFSNSKRAQQREPDLAAVDQRLAPSVATASAAIPSARFVETKTRMLFSASPAAGQSWALMQAASRT